MTNKTVARRGQSGEFTAAAVAITYCINAYLIQGNLKRFLQLTVD